MPEDIGYLWIMNASLAKAACSPFNASLHAVTTHTRAGDIPADIAKRLECLK